MGGTLLHEVDNVVLKDLTSERPSVSFDHDGAARVIACAYVVGADGFHGVSRRSIPSEVLTECEKVCPFGWLGVLSGTRPVHGELIHARHSRGFALCSMRSQVLSRYDLQVSLGDHVEDWTVGRVDAPLARRGGRPP